jgi:hypothetical protein
MNPHQALINWYNELPEDLKDDVAILAGLHLPTLPQKDSNPSINELAIINEIRPIFEEWLKDEDGKLRARLTKVLIARTLIDFFVIRKRTRQYMASSVEGHEESVEEFAQEGQTNLVEPLQKIIDRAPFTYRQWDRAREAWLALRDAALSDDSLDRWEHIERYGE